ncbi:unnamed protein product [Cuscuta campestris]|uniref:NADP-dependent oxidoreductase domain-containing protein n=1 Tax=Cuscuta campestris TaxID=132261 RepID=A0A484LLS7_9ASTE|nr:unnamed protein product [Cuscuta campestris]
MKVSQPYNYSWQNCNLRYSFQKTGPRELGIGIVPYSPLGRGFFAGKKRMGLSLKIVLWEFSRGFKEKTWTKTGSYI